MFGVFLAAHNKPILIRDLLKELLPKLYNETRVRPELIREVEMGPFKHTVDGNHSLSYHFIPPISSPFRWSRSPQSGL